MKSVVRIALIGISTLPWLACANAGADGADFSEGDSPEAIVDPGNDGPNPVDLNPVPQDPDLLPGAPDPENAAGVEPTLADPELPQDTSPIAAEPVAVPPGPTEGAADGVSGQSGTPQAGTGGTGPSYAGTGGTPLGGGASGMPTEPTAGAGGTMNVPATGYPDPALTLEIMRRANAWFMNQHPDPGAPAPGNRPSNLWTRGVYYEGLMALYEVDADAAFKQYAIDWGQANSWGLRYGVQSSDADPQCAGQTHIDLYELDGRANPERIADIQASIDLMVDASTTKAWTWIDAVQMSMPVFVRLGQITGDTTYFDAMWGLYEHTRNTEGGGLFDEETGLWWRDADYNPGGTYTRSPNGIDIYWSRGNGWVIAALVRVLDRLPEGSPYRTQFEADFRAMATTLAGLQRADGFWNASLLDPMHCAAKGLSEEDGPESSGTALFAYGVGWGIRNGLLDEATYSSVVKDAWTALSELALHDDGFLGYVQSTGAEPCDPEGERGLGYDVAPNFDDYGVGCLLLAGSEVYRLGGL